MFLISNNINNKRAIDRKFMMTQTWILSRHFLKKMSEVNLSVQGKYLTVFAANDRIQG